MSRSPFPSVRVSGSLLPAELFSRVLDDATLAGRDPEDYSFGARKTVREAAARAFDDLGTEWQAFTRNRERGKGSARDWLRALFGELGYGILETSSGITIADKTYKVTHLWHHVPMHLLPWATDLDHKTKGVAGAADAAPQSMVQELLNNSDAHLWAIVSNGQTLRLLRDSRALAGSAYVEFDLDLIFTERLYSDFMVLFRLVHASRFVVDGESLPKDCWLEKWRDTAVKQGERARERLRVGVRDAITTLGTGFLRHPANSELRAALASGALGRFDYKRSVLRLVYRLLFWFVAEDRDVLLDPEAPLAARERYARYFSARKLRERARRGGADHHEDLWDAVRLVFDALGTEQGQAALALPGIGGLFERITRDAAGELIDPSLPDELDAPLEGLRLSNAAVIEALRSLAVIESDGNRRPVDFQNLDSEELGSVYESLLELDPVYDLSEQTFALQAAAGNERKTTGSYYTPSSLTEALLDSALDPMLDEAATSATDDAGRIEALLRVTVCDPACGSGHFLVAAARRIARRVAQLRSGENEPSPTIVRHAMREVVSRCIYGVDINETAAELAKVSLWLESVEPGKPLPFLDANIRVGNSLLGTTPALIEKGIPKEAFKPLTGDDKDAAKAIVKLNAKELGGQVDMFTFGGAEMTNEAIAQHTAELVAALPGELVDVYAQRRRLRQIDEERLGAKRKADAWCAAFVQPMDDDHKLHPITEGTLLWIGEGAENLVQSQTLVTVEQLTRDYRFFHWHVEFPHIFEVPEGGVDSDTGWRGGFTCVLGNPPWERVKLQEQEFFAARHPKIAQAKNAAARKKAIAALEHSDDELDKKLFKDFRTELRVADGWSHLLRETGRYPLTGRGDINTYAVFAETGRTILAPRARVGMVLPTGIATDATTQYFFKDLVTTRTLASIYDFENEEKLFVDVDHRVRFCLWTSAGKRSRQDRINLAFRLRRPIQIQERRFTLTPDDITLLNPNTGTCPVFDYKRNAEITLAIYRHVGRVLWREEPDDNPWQVTFLRMLDMANDSGLFRDKDSLEADDWSLDGNVFVRGGERMLPLYEAKMVHHFDHRLGTYDGQTEAQSKMGTLPRLTAEQKDDPSFAVLPRYWVPEKEVTDRLARKSWDKDWLLGWRDICRSSDTRTLIASAFPVAAIGHTFPLITSISSRPICLYANLSSIVADYVARQKMAGTHLTYGYMNQLPVLPPVSYSATCGWDQSTIREQWVADRVIELSYTTYDMAGFARDHGDEGGPFRWNEGRRFWLRAELDAAYFHLHGVPRDDVDYIMDTFRAFKNNDPDRFTRTKTAILDIYDAMAKAIESGEPYRTMLDPPPGQGDRHPAKTEKG
ncbi:Eco57I restriction-modification methylase domain-containing protein [Actinokineospora xionganensis]|uniref:site-specific DNA-methyltransferase (adenine-specific) n=1 Tax=Actinokineospora xionganensis TaxID=2684470 RepID=A0ABR7L5W6_9PSEU|nr:DNA methyltransferase [Actinokineospora xionganensis]MBC6448081.1 N-6 DNA methylase [Actinokineospora xionganensis]